MNSLKSIEWNIIKTKSLSSFAARAVLDVFTNYNNNTQYKNTEFAASYQINISLTIGWMLIKLKFRIDSFSGTDKDKI